jgi:hypothetical protein
LVGQAGIVQLALQCRGRDAIGGVDEDEVPGVVVERERFGAPRGVAQLVFDSLGRG